MLKQLTVGLNGLAGFYLFFLFVWLGLRLLWFDRLWWLALLNTGAFFLLLPLVLALPWCVWQRRWALLAGFGIPLAIALHWYLPLFIPALPFSPLRLSAPAAAQDGASLKLMSFNVLWSNQDYDAIAQVIRAENPDIIGFQELRPEHLPQLQARLGDRYPYSAVHPQPDYHTVGSLSRLPIEQMETFANPPMERGLKLRLRLGNAPDSGPLMVWVTHLAPSNLFSFGPRHWVAIARDRFAQRMTQVDELATAFQSPVPLVMLCDCNMTQTSQTYINLARVLRDSFWEVGWGFGHTFVGSGRLPLQRIDYIWHSSNLRAIEAHVVAGGGSDHLPVVATVRLGA